MRRIVETVLVWIMIMSLGVSAYAAGTVGRNDSQNIDVTAKYEASLNTPAVYSVDIVWDSMVFTYSETGSMVWNPETHTYEEQFSGGWDKETADITVTNHSNVDVNVSFAYAGDETFGVTASLSGAEMPVKLAAGVEGDVAGAASTVATLTVSGKPNDAVTAEGAVVGRITVEIA